MGASFELENQLRTWVDKDLKIHNVLVHRSLSIEARNEISDLAAAENELLICTKSAN